MAEKVLTKMVLEICKCPLMHSKCRSTSSSSIAKYQTSKNEDEVAVSVLFFYKILDLRMLSKIIETCCS